MSNLLNYGIRLRRANPESAHFAKGICVPINRMGDFYRARGQSGDAERALTQFEESLKIAQRLYEANPNSAQVARDLLVSLERMSDIASSSNAPTQPRGHWNYNCKRCN